MDKQTTAQRKTTLGKKRGRLLLIGLLVITLATFFHFREEKVEFLELGSPAKHYVIALVDFSFLDKQATVFLKQEARSSIGTIYSLANAEIGDALFHFEQFLVNDSSWRTALPGVTFSQLYEGMNEVKTFLLQTFFTDHKTMQQLRQLNKLKTHYYQYAGDKAHPLVPAFWHDVTDYLLRRGVDEKVAVYLVEYFSHKRWSLEINYAKQKKLQGDILAAIPKKFTKILAGTPLVIQGEEVTARHIEMVRAMNRTLNKSQHLWSITSILSSVFFALIVVTISMLYFSLNQRKTFDILKNTALYVVIILVTLVLARSAEVIGFHYSFPLVKYLKYPLFIPFVSILLAVLLNVEIAFFSAALLSIILALDSAGDYSRFLVINFLSGTLALYFSRNLRRRRQVFGVCAKVGLGILPVLYVYQLATGEFWSDFFVSDVLVVGLFMITTAILIVGLLPILEAAFQVMTDITLMEYMDPNNELLHRLSLEAPGTYQHCLVVGSLAERAAQSIGANGLFCRVATLYHDIGKLANPHYFTENQMGGFNIHQLLTPIESTQVIVAHVKEGEILAKKHGLPQSFIDVILEHHGTTLVYYFYCKQVELASGDVENVDEIQFRYPGPKPRSKESAIIMLCDTIEAASRSLEEVNEETITELVDRLIGEKLDEGQLNDCQLTFEELGIMKNTVIRTLAITRHLRIKYPEKRYT